MARHKRQNPELSPGTVRQMTTRFTRRYFSLLIPLPEIPIHPDPPPFMRPRFLCLAFVFLSAALCLSAQTPPAVPTAPRPGSQNLMPGAAIAPNPSAVAPAGTDEAPIN